MKCLRCSNTAQVGQRLCAECLGRANTNSASGFAGGLVSGLRALWRRQGGGGARTHCIKCGKPAEPEKVLCAECLGKHQPPARKIRKAKDRKKKSRLFQFVELLLRRFVADENVSSIEERTEYVIAVIRRLLFLALAISTVSVSYRVWRVVANKPLPPPGATETLSSNTERGRSNSFRTSTGHREREGSRRGGIGRGKTSDSSAPTIDIREPADGAVFKAGDNLTISASPGAGSEAPYSVVFFIREGALCEVKAPPFNCPWGPLPLGNHVIHAQAFNKHGVAGPTDSVMIKVVTPTTFNRMNLSGRPLRIFITAPADDARVVLDSQSASTTVHFKGWMSDSIKVEKLSARINSQSCSIQGGKDFSGSCSITSPGNYTLFVEAAQAGGDSVSSFTSFTADRNSVEFAARQANPYHSNEELYEVVQDWGGGDPIWEPNDPAAVSIAPEEEPNRLAPMFYEAAITPEVSRFVGMRRLSDVSTAGSFDDYFATLSVNNAPPTLSWSAPSGNISIPVQPRLFGFSGTAPLPPPLNRSSTYGVPRFASRGISFVSFYDEAGGHATLMDTPDKNVPMERDVYFLSTLATTAAGSAYIDNLPDEISDSFDGLFTHYFVVAGEKGRESAAVTKLMAAGSFLPYETKRVLKMTGNYAAILQWLWRAALPYSDSEGNGLAFSHEARHRVAYAARGSENLSFLSANQSYHRYNEALHMREMARLAGSFKGSLPPITMLSLVDYSVTKGDDTVVPSSTWDEGHQRIKLMLPTVARIWGDTGETIHVRIDLGRSYDIFGKSLTFRVEPLYSEHKPLISISQESASRFLLSVRFSAEFPRSRIPVIATASNGTFEGTPVFINFLWPEAALKSVSLPKPFDPQKPETHVNRNKRPMVSSQTPLNLAARVGSTVRIPLSCSDPEGFNTSWIRWSQEPGRIENSVYILPVSSEYAGRTLTLHFICSDGTGGYGSIERILRIE